MSKQPVNNLDLGEDDLWVASIFTDGQCENAAVFKGRFDANMWANEQTEDRSMPYATEDSHGNSWTSESSDGNCVVTVHRATNRIA